MSDIIDAWAREQIGKLWGAHGKLETTVIGIDGKNGLRSEMRALEDWCGKNEIDIRTVNENIRHYIDVEREESCYGLAALAKYESEQDDEEKGDREVTIAQMNTKA